MQYTKLETMSAHAIRVDFLAALNKMKKKTNKKLCLRCVAHIQQQQQQQHRSAN